jgi:hypothetical protein
VEAVLAVVVKGGGGRTFVADDVAHTDVSADDFRHWASRALQEIAGKVAGTRPSPNRSVADWRFPERLTTWRAALGKDFALVVLLVDAYETGPTDAASAASAHTETTQTGVACLVSLEDGRLVRCETSPRKFGDLRSRDAARAAVGELASGICPDSSPRTKAD